MPAQVVLIVLLAWMVGRDAETARASDAAPAGETRSEVVIRHREFSPGRTVLPRGRIAHLQFRNLDSELHSFAPAGWIDGEHVTVSGNGAPEFGPEGLKRVIIPPEGATEIRFTVQQPGEYAYRCDMPGHQMSGIIVVE